MKKVIRFLFIVFGMFCTTKAQEMSSCSDGEVGDFVMCPTGTYSDIENDRIPDPQTVVRQGGGKQ